MTLTKKTKEMMSNDSETLTVHVYVVEIMIWHESWQLSNFHVFRRWMSYKRLAPHAT